ncbi:Uncharacterised protein [Salmonella enterica subsp. diarizonae]|uniref:Uncharacterized protein n=1 Tax=Salmonella diarizonae TaxID=59204 RepID=A0A379TX71_SALDZ|nr:Uncharacterised protein [Salmonella enterica subsp. diarizonae]
MRPRLRRQTGDLIVQVSYLLSIIIDLRHTGTNRDIDLFILIAQILIGGFELVYQPSALPINA